MPVEDICEVRIEGAVSNTGKRLIQVTHWEQTSVDGADIFVDMKELGTVVLERVIQNVLPLLPSIYQFISVMAQKTYPLRSVASRVLPEDPEVGALVEEALPLDVAIVASLRTNFPGRSGIGRNYWGPVAKSKTGTDLLDEAHSTAWAVALGELFGDPIVTATSGTEFSSVVFSPTRAAEATPPNRFRIRDIEVDAVLRNMVRRGSLPRLPIST